MVLRGLNRGEGVAKDRVSTHLPSQYLQEGLPTSAFARTAVCPRADRAVKPQAGLPKAFGFLSCTRSIMDPRSVSFPGPCCLLSYWQIGRPGADATNGPSHTPLANRKLTEQ